MNLYVVYEGDYFLRVPDHVTHVCADDETEAIGMAFIADWKMRGHLEYRLKDENYLSMKLGTKKNPILKLFEGNKHFFEEYKNKRLSNEAILYISERLNGLGFAATKVNVVSKEEVFI